MYFLHTALLRYRYFHIEPNYVVDAEPSFEYEDGRVCFWNDSH